ncbi:hypothetical protein JCM19000A_17800 [Silvimonas sp. JCM 19000]
MFQKRLRFYRRLQDISSAAAYADLCNLIEEKDMSGKQQTPAPNWPSKNPGKPSGGGRTNAPPKSGR